jgi:hypothetical protein
MRVPETKAGRMPWRHPRGAFAAVVLLATCTACNQSPFAVVPVSGTVLLDGQPLAGGVINFQPVVTGTSVNGGPGSSARFDSSGRFSLATMRGQPGAVVGKHRVKIYSFNAETAKGSDGGGTPPRERVPARYNYRSELMFDVPPGGTDKADFSITTK